MKNRWNSYLHSFLVRKPFWSTVLIDLVFLTVLILIVTAFGAYLTSQSAQLSGGQTTAQLESMLSTDPEGLLAFLQDLKWLLITALAGIVALALFTLFGYSFCQAWIWNLFNGTKLQKKNYWRWNALHLAVLLLLLGFLIGYLIVKLITGFIFYKLFTISKLFYLNHQTVMNYLMTGLNSLVSFFLILLFVITIFFFYHHFVKSYRVWSSIGAGFKVWRQHWKKILWVIVLALVTGAVPTFISLLLGQLLLLHPFILLAVQITISVLYLAWVRWYVIRELLSPKTI